MDTTDNALLQGLNAPVTIDPGSLPFYAGDGQITFNIYLLNKTGSTLSSYNPYTIILNAGLALLAYIDDGTVAGTIYTQQVNFTNDPSLQFFTGALTMNTAALLALIGNSTSASAWLKIAYMQNGLITTILSVQISIGAGANATVGPLPAGLQALSVQAAQQEFLLINGAAGQGPILQSAAGKKGLLYYRDNGDGSASLDIMPLN